ncbi:MAG TPA: methyl-accepting chemotaxis protein [Myxococcales bacterium]|nr:methyl-accepting chemotaxis protein [Myxococcales bacterium]
MRAQLKLRDRLALTGLLASASLAAVFGIGHHASREAQSALDGIYRQNVRPLIAVQEMDAALREVRFRVAGVLLDELPTVGSRNHLKEARVAIARAWAEFEASHEAQEPEEVELRPKVDAGVALLPALFDKLDAAYAAADKKALTTALEDDWPVIQQKLQKPLSQLIPVQVAAVQRKYEATAAQGGRLSRQALAVCVAAALLVLLTFITIARSIGSGVARLQVALGRVAQGDLGARCDPGRGDELGEMGQALNRAIERVDGLLSGVTQGASKLAGSSSELTSVAGAMTESAAQTSSQATSVSAAAEQVGRNVQSVASAAEEMEASIREIARNAGEAAQVAASAVGIAKTTNGTVAKLGDSSIEIGNVVKLINTIAAQTRLLALNATIEAARAGEAGKGFAVVANEVKELARHTADATEDISRRVHLIQDDTRGAQAAIAEIGAVVGRINDIQNTIAGAVEQQAATTREIGHSVGEAAKASAEIAANVAGVARAAGSTSEGATRSQKSAEELRDLAAHLRELVGGFNQAAQAWPAPADRDAGGGQTLTVHGTAQ